MLRQTETDLADLTVYYLMGGHCYNRDSHPLRHFMVCTTYFEAENNPVMLGTLHLHDSTEWKLQIGADGFTCEVLPQPGGWQPRSSVRVAYANV